MHVSKYITKYANQRECVRTYICIEVYVISEKERERTLCVCLGCKICESKGVCENVYVY